MTFSRSADSGYYETLGLSSTGLPLLRDYILQRSGVFFADDKQDLMADKLAELVTALGMTSFLDYYYLLKYDDPAHTHWKALMDRLAVPETYFWRQPEQFMALVENVIPSLGESRGNAPLRIWSAACCSGEEPISIAMALEEAGEFNRRSIEIVASDASHALIDRARAGLYSERSFRSLDPERRERFFRRENGMWRVDPVLHSRVRYTTANLLDARETAPMASSDVIFCRNVFIYFSDDAIRKVIRDFVDGMPTPGYVFLGAAESLVRLGTELSLEEIARAFVYVKHHESAASNDATRKSIWQN
jgi:chemotaxis protein methyltransferase CheR